jgi:predicted Rdx family selenoprotein
LIPGIGGIFIIAVNNVVVARRKVACFPPKDEIHFAAAEML